MARLAVAAFALPMLFVWNSTNGLPTLAPSRPAVAILHAYIADAGSNSVIDINAKTGAVLRTIAVGKDPVAIVFTYDGRTAYVVNRGDSTIMPIDTATGTPGVPIAVAADPTSIAIDFGASTVWIGSCGVPGVQPVDLATRTAGASNAMAACPADIVLANKDFVSEPSIDSVQYFNPDRPPFQRETVAAGLSARGLAVEPDGIDILAADSGSNTVTLVDSRHGITSGTFATVGLHPTSLDINPRHTRIVTANSGDGTVTVLAGGAVSGSIAVGGSPDFIRFLPDGRYAWVLDSTHGVGHLISLATMTSGPAIAFGISPVAIAIAPDQPPVARLTCPTGHTGSPITLDGSASTGANYAIRHYTWQWGDGTFGVQTTQSTGAHTYKKPGSYTAMLEVIDAIGNSTGSIYMGHQIVMWGGQSAFASCTVVVA